MRALMPAGGRECFTSQRGAPTHRLLGGGFTPPNLRASSQAYPRGIFVKKRSAWAGGVSDHHPHVRGRCERFCRNSRRLPRRCLAGSTARRADGQARSRRHHRPLSMRSQSPHPAGGRLFVQGRSFSRFCSCLIPLRLAIFYCAATVRASENKVYARAAAF